jgi:4-amino-4-deoxy-L-arabinose transferase-like glycosyltransferase
MHPGHHDSSTPVIPLWLVWAAALLFVIFGLGGFAILDNNEGLYAEIPREMLASHDWRMWVIPHLNGLPYMEKPPLLYWLTAASFSLFGISEWSARLVPALSALSCVGLLAWFGNAVRRPLAGRLAALIFVSGLGVTAMSHVLMFDMLLTALLTAALMFAYLHTGADARDGRLLRWSYAFLALAVLAKGLVALVLFVAVTGLYSISKARSSREFFHLVGGWFDWRALLVFFAVAAPWHIAAAIVEPIFGWFYFVNEHVLRFLGQREPHDYYAGAWWYYLPRMVIYLFPWSFLLPCLLARKRPSFEQGSTSLARFLFLGWLAPLAFFSLSGAKANYYLVAVMPIAAMHLAVALEERRFLGGFGRALPGLMIALLCGLLAIALTLRSPTDVPALVIWNMPLQRFVLLGTGGVMLLAAAAAVMAWRLPRVGIVAYIGIPVWMLVLLMATLEAMEPTISTRATVAYLRGELAGRPVYLYREFEQQSSLPFYLRQALPVIDAHSADLFWGMRLRPDNAIALSNAQFADRLTSQSLAIVVTDHQVKEFRAAAFYPAFKGEKRIGNSTVFFN